MSCKGRLITTLLVGIAFALAIWNYIPHYLTKRGEVLHITSGEALERKYRSELVLRRDGVPVNQSLPVIETKTEAHLRSQQAVAYRTLALLAVAVKGEGLEQPIVEKLVGQYDLAPYFTPKEAAFIKNPTPSKNDRTQFTWRYESAWVLLWALGYVKDLGQPSTICDVAKAVTFMKERTTAQFLADSKLRPLSQLLDEADLIYRYDWAVVDARIRGKPAPSGLDPGVVQERHYALNWLIGYMDQEWDDVSTDT